MSSTQSVNVRMNNKLSPHCFSIGSLTCHVSSNEFGIFCIPASSAHRPASRAVINHNVWEPDTIKCISRGAGDGDVVHAGSYFGDFLPALSKALLPGKKLGSLSDPQE